MTKLRKNCPICKKGVLSVMSIAGNKLDTKVWVYACSRCAFKDPVDDEEAVLVTLD